MLSTDPEHPKQEILTIIKNYFLYTFTYIGHFNLILYAFILSNIILIFDKKRKEHSVFYLIFSTALVFFSFVLICLKFSNVLEFYYNAVVYPMFFLGITSYILIDKKPKNLFISLFLVGILYSFCTFSSSNSNFHAIASAFSISNIASFIFTGIALKEIKSDLKHKNIFKFVLIPFLIITFFSQIALQSYIKIEYNFWEEPLKNIKSVIPVGPAKGIKTNESNCKHYTDVYNDIYYYDNIKMDNSTNVLMLTIDVWTYLAVENKSYSTYSAWQQVNFDKISLQTIEKLELYYELHPDKIPDYIYVSKDINIDLTNIYQDVTKYGYKIDEETELSYKLSKK